MPKSKSDSIASQPSGFPTQSNNQIRKALGGGLGKPAVKTGMGKPKVLRKVNNRIKKESVVKTNSSWPS